MTTPSCHQLPWCPVGPVIFIDCVNVKIREGNVANRPIYVALAVTVHGTRDILGLWAGEHGDGEGAKYWLRVLSEIKNRGVADVCLVVCDGLKGLPEAIEQVWPQAITQTCVVHLLRNSFRYASKKDWSAIAKDLKPIYTAPSENAALEAFLAFTEKWDKRYPAIIKLWDNAWAEFVPFLRFGACRRIARVVSAGHARMVGGWLVFGPAVRVSRLRPRECCGPMSGCWDCVVDLHEIERCGGKV
jgi:transposase-like protein